MAVDASGRVLPDGIPPGSTFLSSNSSGNSWKTPDGKIFIQPTDGSPAFEYAGGATTDTSAGATVLRGGRAVTDAVGLTVPESANPNDLTKTPEFQRLTDAADTFGGDYTKAKTQADETRGIDLDTIAELQAAAAGKRPSAAEALMRKHTDQNARQALGLAATLGGSNPGMALRAGLDASADAGARSAADMAALRAKEQEAARALLAQQTGHAADRDSTGAANAANTFAGSVISPFNAALQNEALRVKGEAANLQHKADIFKTVATPLVASDPELKGSAASAPASADSFLDSLNPTSFQYKQPGPNMPPGERLGVMATALPKHDVATGPDGKKWISATVISDILAGLGRVNEKVEGRRPQGGTVTGGSPEYAAAMDYMTAPRSDAGTAARAASGQPPLPRSMTNPSSVEEPMVPMSAVRAMLAQAGIR